MFDDSERWLPVVGYEGYYEVSSAGRVRSLDRTVTRGNHWRHTHGRLLIQTPNCATAYLCVGLHMNGKRKQRTIHSLVAEAFIGPRPSGLDVRHVNGNRADCRALNLAYGTRSENCYDKRLHGTDHNVNKTHCPRKHSYSGANLKIDPASGSRVCRECDNERGRCKRAVERRRHNDSRRKGRTKKDAV